MSDTVWLSDPEASENRAPTFTFAVVNWNTADMLDRCLASIYQEGAGYEIEVLVADNASRDGSADLVEARYPQATLVRNDENLGFARGHQALFERSRGRYHILVNSDVRLQPGCLTRIEERMRADERIGVLGCRLLRDDGTIQQCCRRFPTLWYQAIEASGIGRLFPGSGWLNAYRMGDFDHTTSREVDQVMGSFFLVRRSLIDAIGTLDTAFFMYYEEVDYCLRCRRAGYKVYYEAAAAVVHEGGGSSKLVRVATVRRTVRSMHHYFRKHRGGWVWIPLVAIASLDLLTHAVHALLTRNQPWLTVKAYGLGLWDLVTCRPANTGTA